MSDKFTLELGNRALILRMFLRDAVRSPLDALLDQAIQHSTVIELC